MLGDSLNRNAYLLRFSSCTMPFFMNELFNTDIKDFKTASIYCSVHNIEILFPDIVNRRSLLACKVRRSMVSISAAWRMDDVSNTNLERTQWFIIGYLRCHLRKTWSSQNLWESRFTKIPVDQSGCIIAAFFKCPEALLTLEYLHGNNVSFGAPVPQDSLIADSLVHACS